jgi:hypothetical protein
VQTAREAPDKPSQSIAAGGPYTGPGQHGGVKPSNETVEKLYTEFLEWKQRTKN